MKRFPLVPTLLVLLAMLAMVRLGVWQIHRAHEKDALTAQYARNAALPPMALPPSGIVDEKLLFRRAKALCLEVTAWRLAGGRAASGRSGTRFIAECRTGVEGPGFVADMGVSPDPKTRPHWRGGEVEGRIAREPPRSSLRQRFTGKGLPPRPMIVSVRPAPGLEASAQPEPPQGNSSWSYAVQWFLFAAVAGIVYVLALRRRRREP